MSDPHIVFENEQAHGVEIPDPATWCDALEDELQERFALSRSHAVAIARWHEAEISREVFRGRAEQLGRIVGLLVKPTRNLPAVVRALALATGLDELNGVHSQAEVARELGCTRALISHYVCAWADLIGLDVFKFRKSASSREVFAASRRNVVSRSRRRRAATSQPKDNI